MHEKVGKKVNQGICGKMGEKAVEEIGKNSDGNSNDKSGPKIIEEEIEIVGNRNG